MGRSGEKKQPGYPGNHCSWFVPEEEAKRKRSGAAFQSKGVSLEGNGTRPEGRVNEGSHEV